MLDEGARIPSPGIADAALSQLSFIPALYQVAEGLGKKNNDTPTPPRVSAHESGKDHYSGGTLPEMAISDMTMPIILAIFSI